MQNTDPSATAAGAAPPSRREGVQAIARAGSVLRALEAHPRGLALGELAQAVALPKSTVHRLVAALSTEQLLGTGADGSIVLGDGLVRLAAAGSRPLEDRLRPALAQLHAQLGETVDLAVRDGSQMRFVDQLPAAHRLRAVSAVGETFPLHCTANGKAMLAALSDRRALALLPGRLPRPTRNTIHTRAALLDELQRARASGVAFDREEHTIGISAVGAAVLEADGRAVAAISVPVPTARFAGAEQRYARAAAAAAREASRLLAAGQ